MQINQKALEAIFSDLSAGAELDEMLNAMIDDELARSDDLIDFELIDECTDLLLELQQKQSNGAAIIIPLISSEKIMAKCRYNGFKNLSRGVQAGLVASIILLTGVTANAAIYKISGVNVIGEVAQAVSEKLDEWGITTNGTDKIEELTTKANENLNNNKKTEATTKKEETTNKAQESTTNQNQQTTTQKTQEKTTLPLRSPVTKPAVELVTFDDTKQTTKPQQGNTEQTTQKGNVVAIRLEFSNSFKTEYLWGEALDVSGLTVEAVYDGGASEVIDSSLCTFEGYNKAKVGSQKIVVTYKGASASFDITLSKTVQTVDKKPTGFKATPRDKLVYTTRDVKINLDGISVKITYSDGSISASYNKNDMKLLTEVDFSTVGEQEVQLLIAGKYVYSFTITIVEYQEDDSILGIEQQPGAYKFYLGEEPDLDNHYFEVRMAVKDYYRTELIKLSAEGVVVSGIDTSEESADRTKTFTLYYKGFTSTFKYIVVERPYIVGSAKIRSRMNAKINYDYNTPEYKALYYLGEDLAVGKGKSVDDVTQLVSYNPITPDEPVTRYEPSDYYYRNTDWGVNVTWVAGSATEFIPIDECDIIGYDPYTCGFQTLDIYYNNIYLTSFIVFVYGDEGCVPVRNSIPDAYSKIQTSKNYHWSAWRAALGNGLLDADEMGADYNTVYENDGTGWQTATLKDFEGVEHTYKVCRVYAMTNSTPKLMDIDSLTFNVRDIDNLDFGNAFISIATNTEGTKELPLSECSVSFTYWRSVIRITSNTRLHSVVAYMCVVPDRTKFISDYYYNYLSFIYSDGYEDAFSIEVDGSDYYLEKGGSLNNYYSLKAYDNETLGLKLDSLVTVENVDYDTVGEYDAVFTYKEFNSVISTRHKVYVLDKKHKEKIEIFEDPNKGRCFFEGDTFDATGIKLKYYNVLGEEVIIGDEDISYEIIDGGTGHKVVDKFVSTYIEVKYTYVTPNGKQLDYCAAYDTWCRIKNTRYFADDSMEKATLSWEGTQHVDYYKIRVKLGKKYGGDFIATTTEPYIEFTDEPWIADAYRSITAYITPVMLDEEGNEKEGLETTTQFSRINEYIELSTDPNRDEYIVDVENMDISGVKLNYHDNYNNITTITDEDFTCESKVMIKYTNDYSDYYPYVKATYSYTSPTGKVLTCSRTYKSWSKIDNYKDENVVENGELIKRVTWSGYEGAVYYDVKVSVAVGQSIRGYSYRVNEPCIKFTTDTIAGYKKDYKITITPYRIDSDGNEIRGSENCFCAN